MTHLCKIVYKYLDEMEVNINNEDRRVIDNNIPFWAKLMSLNNINIKLFLELLYKIESQILRYYFRQNFHLNTLFDSPLPDEYFEIACQWILYGKQAKCFKKQSNVEIKSLSSILSI